MTKTKKKQHHMTSSQFRVAKKSLDHEDKTRKRGRAARPLDIAYIGTQVWWTCPDCGIRNHHKNTGRGIYFCSHCGIDVDLKAKKGN